MMRASNSDFWIFWINLDFDPDACHNAPKLLWIRYPVGISVLPSVMKISW